MCSFFFFCPTDRPTFTRGRAMGNETFYGDGLTNSRNGLYRPEMCTFSTNLPKCIEPFLEEVLRFPFFHGVGGGGGL